MRVQLFLRNRLREELKELLFWSDNVVLPAAPYAIQVLPQTQVHEMVTGPLARIEPTTFCIIELPGPHDVFGVNFVDCSGAACGAHAILRRGGIGGDCQGVWPVDR